VFDVFDVLEGRDTQDVRVWGRDDRREGEEGRAAPAAEKSKALATVEVPSPSRFDCNYWRGKEIELITRLGPFGSTHSTIELEAWRRGGVFLATALLRNFRGGQAQGEASRAAKRLASRPPLGLSRCRQRAGWRAGMCKWVITSTHPCAPPMIRGAHFGMLSCVRACLLALALRGLSSETTLPHFTLHHHRHSAVKVSDILTVCLALDKSSTAQQFSSRACEDFVFFSRRSMSYRTVEPCRSIQHCWTPTRQSIVHSTTQRNA
jgi:hypothetical protein